MERAPELEPRYIENALNNLRVHRSAAAEAAGVPRLQEA
jgi:hypothetical protein